MKYMCTRERRTLYTNILTFPCTQTFTMGRRWIDKDIKNYASFTKKALKYLLNKLTPLYSKIYYKEENYLKVKTKLFIYPSPPYSKGWYVRYVRYIKYIHRSHRSHRSHVPNHMIRLTPHHLIPLVPTVLPLAY